MPQISKSTLTFLSDLKIHNEREWFHKNRNRYDETRLNYETFVQALIDEIVKFDPILKGLEAKSCMYRINRDIRFTPDKTIYKTHLGAFIVRGGKKNGNRFPGYYFHVEPGGSLIAGGAYMPPTSWLSVIREKIDDKGADLVRISQAKDLIAYFGHIEGERVKTVPRGYPSDHPYLELLKLRSFLIERTFTDKEITSGKCFDLIVKMFRAMKPLNDFLTV